MIDSSNRFENQCVIYLKIQRTTHINNKRIINLIELREIKNGGKNNDNFYEMLKCERIK